ncbi:MAG TPA: glycine cleavage system protein GcvH [Bacillota bacterium]|nr:glycine cleavage system protein GcvH [Bacillota bacterium]HPA54745.1 glycine cleavage system protein GcvH [Bacillota bacterium]HPX67808.1 glycine cleavage system protein GcvH [Bacillota bacterium]HQA64287.1 glycine cleavage system protein GcvH [Bacillota bacterium]HQO42020.1 glycine cleavage system protein GcvH [Bacillota bacterium]
METKSGLLYSKDHEWVRVEGEKAYVGITDYAQHALGEIVYVELPAVGDELNAGDVFSVIESVKAASDSYLPVAGKVLEVNEALSDSPQLVNEDPYGSWIVVVEITDKAGLDELMSEQEYQEFCDKEA